MAARPILQLGDPLLRQVSTPIGCISDVRGILSDLRDTLHEFRRTHGFGRGISAVQIGEPVRLIYIEIDGRSLCLHNPEYLSLRSCEGIEAPLADARGSEMGACVTSQLPSRDREGAVARPNISHLLGADPFQLWDDCFSFPDLMVWVERYRSVAVQYLDEHGESRTLEASGALSELIQHEMDHLDGMLAIDRAAAGRHSFCTRREWERRYRATQAGPPASEE